MKTKKLLLYMSEELHKEIKIRAAQHGISMSHYINQAIFNRFDTEANLGWDKKIKLNWMNYDK